MLDFPTSTSVSDGIDLRGKVGLWTTQGWMRTEKPQTAGGGVGGTIGCRCNRYSCPIRAFMAGLLFERAVQADLWVERDFRSEHPLLRKAICSLWAYQMGSMQGCLWVCVISSLLLCVSLFKWASWNLKRMYRRMLCVHGDRRRGCVLHVSERVWMSMHSLL